jgi:cyclopropane fatty-acyl-phospholipid synthase-like methyltransferase
MKDREMDLREERDYWRDLYFKREREMQAAEIEDVKITIKKMDIKPGDTVLISAPGQITDEMAKRLKEHFQQYLPGVKALVFGDGLNAEIRTE